ncbi:MAG: TetR/AcrR family transcriptional regulator, partial [Chloroflexales bacterium]|nr:TetR/AcrR family transcriptional regulator [Chloroflexales bacterium]
MGTRTTRDAILDAAERLIAREGVPHLTIGRVAEEAQVSRGGLFYHFPSKEALVQSLLERMVVGWQQALEAMMAQDPEPFGRLTRAYARLVLLQAEDATEQSSAVVGALIAGLAFDPQLLDPLHQQLRVWQEQSEAELDPAVAAVVRLTTHALWTNSLLLT